MNIVFLVGSYYPFHSAVSKCVGNVIDVLAKENNVKVICVKSNIDQKNNERYKEHNVIRIVTKDSIIRSYLMMKSSDNRKKSKMFFNLLIRLYQILSVAYTFLSPVTLKRSLIKQYILALESIDEDIDAIIPACMPFESLVAASLFIDKSSNKPLLIPYLFDQYSASKTLHRTDWNRSLKFNNHVRLENRILSRADKIFAMHSLEDHFKVYHPNLRNIQYVEHPLLTKPVHKSKYPTSTINLTYVGGLYKGYVEANYLLSIIEQMNFPQLMMNFYVIGNGVKIVNDYENRLSDRMKNYGSVKKEIADEVVMSSDILISIAEKSGIQMSSKIFEYISTGKPIIHFYTVDHDVNLSILRKYPLSLCVKESEDDFGKNIRDITNFIIHNNGKIIRYNLIEQIYSDARPEFTANLIKKAIRAVKIKSSSYDNRAKIDQEQGDN